MTTALRRPEEILAYRSLEQILGPGPYNLWTVGPAEGVRRGLEIMTEKDIGFLVVMERDKMVGVLSERDCARRAALTAKPLETTSVADIMIRDVVTVDLAHAFADCLRLMHQHRIRHLPVLHKRNVVAVVSIRDLLSEAVSHHAKIIAELERERLTMFTSTA